jgi:hypothetical protein
VVVDDVAHGYVVEDEEHRAQQDQEPRAYCQIHRAEIRPLFNKLLLRVELHCEGVGAADHHVAQHVRNLCIVVPRGVPHALEERLPLLQGVGHHVALHAQNHVDAGHMAGWYGWYGWYGWWRSREVGIISKGNTYINTYKYTKIGYYIRKIKWKRNSESNH